MQSQQARRSFDQPASIMLKWGFRNNDGYRIRRAFFRPITGYDEQFLIDLENSSIQPIPNFIKAIALLGRVVSFESLQENEDLAINIDNSVSDILFTSKSQPTSLTPSTNTILENITIGDRNSLLLFFRKLIMGDKIQCFVKCPNCNEDMAFELSTDALLERNGPEPKESYTININQSKVIIRPITGMDEENAIMLNQDSSSNTKIEQLIRRCIISSDPPISIDSHLTEDFIDTVSSKLLEIDPLADIIFDLLCPDCQNTFKSPFVVDEFIFREFYSRHAQYEGEVHWLALNYHWSEKAILSLPVKRRKRYVNLINKSLRKDEGEV